MSYVIHGAAGAQGGPLFRRLLASGKAAVGAVRNTAALEGKPTVAVDNGSVESLVSAYRHADGVFVHLPVTAEPERVRQAKSIVEAINRARPGRVVISTSGSIVDSPGSVLQAPDDSAVAILTRGVRESGLSHAIVEPRLYLENLLLPPIFETVKAEGILRYPFGADFAVSWSSHLDVAEVAERLLVDHSVSGLVGVGQRPGLDGAALAQGFSRHLGRPVAFEALSPEGFGDLLTPLFGLGAAATVVGLYQALAQAPDNVIAEETSAQRRLAMAPRSVRQWLADILN
ncbi:hydroxylase [Rhizobium sp. R634]|uniref:NmrA family NAD(P)-binding protein n=1 Tax=Rhizobium sp. R634 TaxID=1764274 RepID=UPI000B5336E0|nr:NmrA family NAD(P)-binding protein [Rhizobium sp. R634]OWV77611.1 hydroxylase [Rhizobium sp. R634]